MSLSLKNTLTSAYYQLRAQPFVRARLLADDTAFWHRKVKEQPLISVETELVEALKRDGIAVTTMADLFSEGSSWFEHMQREYQLCRDRQVQRSKKFYFYELWDGKPTFDPGDPFMRFIIDSSVLRTVNGYFGYAGKCYYMQLYRTELTPPGQERSFSQRWHRDPEDQKICKVFIYLDDVDAGAGPFSYVKGSHGGGKWRSLYPQKPPAGCYPPEGWMEGLIPAEDILNVIGRAGTVIFCDTSGFHRGGYATTRERPIFIGGYESSASPWGFRYKPPMGDVLSAYSELQRFAMTPPIPSRFSPFKYRY